MSEKKQHRFVTPWPGQPPIPLWLHLAWLNMGDGIHLTHEEKDVVWERAGSGDYAALDAAVNEILAKRPGVVAAKRRLKALRRAKRKGKQQ